MPKPFLLIVGLTMLGSVPFAASGAVAPAAEDAVLAEVDGVKLTQTDYDRTHPTALFQARNALYAAYRKATDQLIDDYLLERQAKKEGLTVDQLLEKHVNGAIPKDPSDEVLHVYYEGVDTKEPFETVRPQIVESLRGRRIAKAKAAYLLSLRTEARIIVRVGPPRAQISLKDIPIRGQADAPVTIVEFADYECPYCQNVQPELDKVLATYPGKVAFAFKDMPLPMHRNAEKAAEAAYCAGSQGKYWEYHDLLFSSKQITLPDLKAHALELKLDAKAFDQCLDSGSQASRIKSEFMEAQNYALTGTPAFFINGRFFSGSMDYDTFRRIIEEELKRPAVAQPETASR
jgi:protein-disulfide isomerase